LSQMNSVYTLQSYVHKILFNINFRLFLGLRSCLFVSGFPIKSLSTLPFSSYGHFTLSDLITLITVVNGDLYENHTSITRKIFTAGGQTYVQ